MDSFGLPDETLNKIINVFENYPEIEKAKIFGSRAKGTFKPGSDIDICLLAPSMNLSAKFKLELELDELFLPYKIDLCIFHMIDNQNLIEHIERMGKTIYTKHI